MQEPADQHLVARVDERPRGLLHHRRGAVDAAHHGGDVAVGLGQHPRRGALEQRQRRHLRLDLRHELDRAGPGADHGDAPAAQVEIVVPARRVERGALEGVEALDVGHGRDVQRPGAPDHDARAHLRAVGDPDGPARAVPFQVGDLRAEADAVAEAVAVGDVLQVRPDLGLAGEQPRPVRVGGEGERVEVALHVAGAAGVGVVAPGAAEALPLLQHQEVGAAGLGQPHRRPQPGEPAADDDDVHVHDSPSDCYQR